MGFGRESIEVPGSPVRSSSRLENIQSKNSVVLPLEPSVKRPVAPPQSPVTAVPEPASPHGSVGKKAMPQMRETIGSFAVLLLLDIIVGTTEYRFLGKSAMWMNSITLAAVVGGIQVYMILRQARIDAAGSISFTSALVLSWACMTIVSDALIGIVLVPSMHRLPPNWGFFQQQSPWIWLYCAVLPLAGLGGCLAYLKSLRG
jgi:hypothetical protein